MFYKNARIFTSDFTFRTGAFEVKDGVFGELTLTTSEHKRIEEAYKSARMGSIPTSRTEEEKLMYGDYWPLAVTLTGIMNNKAGLNFSSWDHTALPVAVYAQGPGSNLFVGHYDNTNICNNLMKIMNVK